MADTVQIPERDLPHWERLSTNFPQVKCVFSECLKEAKLVLSPRGLDSYIDNASFLGKMGRGADPMLIYLEEMPTVVSNTGEAMLTIVRDFVWHLARNTNAPSIVPFLQTLAEVSRYLKTQALMESYIELLKEFAERTTGSVHGHHTTFPSPGMPELLKQAPHLLSLVTLQGLRNWINYGVTYYISHPGRQKDFFSLQSADSRAMLQRERHGTLFMENERKLDLYLRALWGDHDYLVPYSLAFDELRKPMPYFDDLGMRIPDVFDDLNGIAGIDRYRAVLAHMCAHRRWSERMVVDNWSPFQRVAVETFEDCRVDLLTIRQYPGLHETYLRLHPIPNEEDLHLEGWSTIRLRLALLSRKVLDPDFEVKNPIILDFAERILNELKDGDSSSPRMAELALLFIARTHTQADLLPHIYFRNTEVSYRDDNRHLWIYIEAGDEEEEFDHLNQQKDDEEEIHALPPRHYHEWDYAAQHYRPDWVSVYESLHPQGAASYIDTLLDKHSALAKRLKRVLDSLKPQDRTRIRFQEEGSELDLDVALRSLIDLKSGSTPDPRVNMSHKTDGRIIAVSLLLDLSQSLDDKAAGTEQTILQLSQEAVSLLGWSIGQLGDPFSIGGFHSNTRHDVRYYHIKGFSEPWGDTVKARLAAMQAGYSTRMGAAIRHAGHYLKNQRADKKLLLVLTDGEPSDIDVDDERLLIEDSKQAVNELDREGIFTYCISLDPKADEYVTDIFDKRYSVIDHVDKLPQKLPELFISLTK